MEGKLGMKILIVTQTVNLDHPILGFFHRWILEFAKQCKTVTVICLAEGRHELPENVRVYSLGKKPDRSSLQVTYAWRFLALAWRLRHEYDVVLVHMNPEYLVIAGWLWQLLHKRVSLWYTHKSVTLWLRVGIWFTHVVFTASPQSLRLKTAKKRVMGHGIDLSELAPAAPPQSDRVQLLTVSRLMPVKRIEVLIDAVRSFSNTLFTIAGGGEASYVASLKTRAAGETAKFIGDVPHERIRDLLADAHLFLHASETGSLDKAPLEALACGVPIITSNREIAALRNPAVMGVVGTEASFTEALEQAIGRRLWEEPAVRAAGRSYIESTHSLESLIPKILAHLGQRS
jgi:glycosyltransferase involved in cell wall biosynthesis